MTVISKFDDYMRLFEIFKVSKISREMAGTLRCLEKIFDFCYLPSVRSTLYPNCSGGYVSSDEIFEGRFRAVPILSSTHQADWQLMAPHYGAAAAASASALTPRRRTIFTHDRHSSFC
jgi:hypothetical protein